MFEMEEELVRLSFIDCVNLFRPMKSLTMFAWCLYIHFDSHVKQP